MTLCSFVVTSCGGKSPGPTRAPIPSPISDRVLVQTKDLPPGLDMRVSQGKQGAPAFDHGKLAAAKKLSDADAEALLSRARPIKDEASDKQEFALRPKSAPPPRTGTVIKGTFPPPASTLLPPAKATDTGDLKVLRYMPEGAVPIAPELTVTFSQPMVAVTSQEDAAATTAVKLTPQPKGKWRWLGTRTVLFDPDPRFPQATTYQVEIPAGTKSTTGGVLKDAVKFTFETPPPSLVQQWPAGNTRLDVPMFAMFDQKIDPKAVLASTKVTAAGQSYDIELLDQAAIDKNKTLASIVKAAHDAEQDGRWLAFRATKPFPRDTEINVQFAGGTPSAEGPNKTAKEQSFSFHTYPPLRVDEAECGWGSECRPGMPFSIVFNNPLDDDAFDDAQVAITPEVPDVKIIQGGAGITISGLTSARTTYKVVLSKALKDTFGQTLGADTTLTFSVGDPTPTFFGPSGMVVLDPGAKKPTLDFFTINYEQLKVRLYSVEPADYDAFGRYMRDRWNHDHPPKMPGKKVFDQLVATAKGTNKLVETSLDLMPALKASGVGHAIAIVEPYPWKETWEPPQMIAWVQATKLGLDAHVDGDNLVAYATDLGTGKPAAGVALEIRPFGTKATSDDKGTATMPLSSRSLKGAHFLLGRRGDDVAFVSDDGGWWNEYGSWVKQGRGKQTAWYVIDDRKMYKPGEDVSLKGWLRAIDYGKNGDVGAASASSVSYAVTDSRGVKIAEGSSKVSAVGGFDTKFTLPKTPNLGYAQIAFKTDAGDTYGHSFQIEEFRRPEFEVSAAASQGPFVVGTSGDVTVNAKYYAGGPLPGAPVNWYVTASETSFTPPNRDEYVFGSWEPWWGYHAWDEEEGGRIGRYKAPKSWSLQGKTDATGAHVLHMDFLSLNPAMPMAVTANASVTDVNRQTWSSAAALIVHPADEYVGLKMKRPFVEKGTPMDLDVIGVDLDGKAVTGVPIEVKASRLDFEVKHGKYKQTRVDPQTCSVKSAVDAVPCRFTTDKGGEYEVVATIVDDKGRPNQTKLTFWVSGGDQPPARELKQERVQLIPDKKEYVGGETAELLLQAPFYPAEGLVTWRRSGIVRVEHIAITGPTATVKVPVTDAMVPNMGVQVDLVGMAARTDDHGLPDGKLPKRPAYATGTIDLPVPAKQRTLAVRVAPALPKVSPGEATKLSIEVRDASGRPVANAETAVIVVDEAVLALTGYQFPNPVDSFYPERGTDTRDYYSQSYVKL
ncbi:MAG: Ig-like domain-containing protein, partial [Deltaproteobacteria bacterium]|nr:Ig-like domain-containing protein [Deltaproteobacteria bacterium]